MAKIRQEIINKILEQANIVDVAKDSVDVKKAGVINKCVCPFHDDHSPSLVLYPSTNQSHCFSCGAHANVIQLHMKLNNLSFPDSVKALCKKYSIPFEEEEQSEEEVAREKRRETHFNYHELVAKEYRQLLQSNEKAKDYAYSRWGKELCEMVGLGYAPAGGRFLVGVKVLDMDILRNIGLCRQNADDFYQDRLVIPIRDRYSRIIGFIARRLDDNTDEGKYKNSPDNEFFHKGEVLFGIDLAWKSAVKSEKAYLVEGAPDCFRLQIIGVSNVMASLGTAWTEKHFRQLKSRVPNVCFIPDTDTPGIEAVIKAGKTALTCGLSVTVKEIPCQEGVKQDADSYFTDKEIFDSVPEVDFVEWYAERLFTASNTVKEKAKAVESMVEVLFSVNDKTQVQLYVSLLKQYTDGQKKVWTDALKPAKEIKHTTSIREPKASTEGQPKCEDYGFKVDGNCYVIETQYGVRTLSNFILEPLFHVRDPLLSRRIFTILNNRGQREIIELTSDDLAKNDRFEARVGEIGNYVWKGRKDDLLRIKEYLFASMNTAEYVRQLGWQPRGFFAFGNGIFAEDGWHEADLYGIVELTDKGNYYLPGHSLLNRFDRKGFVFEHCFVHKEGSMVTLHEVTGQIFKVFGMNGKVAFLFTLASLFHDIVIEVENPSWFPLLNLFGPMGTGKTALADTMASFFMKGMKTIFTNSTIASLSNLIGSSANAVIAIHEYKNDLDDAWIGFLKGLWDLIGRTRMSMNKDGQKEITAVDSGIIITGQEMPTKDPALLSRMILLTFTQSHFSPEESDEFRRLTEIKERGLTHLVFELMKCRDKMEKEYVETFKRVSRQLLERLGTNTDVNRIINNWAVVLSVYEVLKDDLNMDIDSAEIVSFVELGIKRQSTFLNTSDELASFWQILQYLLAERRIFPEGNFRIVRHRIFKPDRKGVEKRWDEPHPVLYLPKAGLIELYQKACREIGNKYIPKESLEFYLLNRDYFLGEKVCRYKQIDKNGYQVQDFDRKDEYGQFLKLEKYERSYCFDYTMLQEKNSLDLERMPTGIINTDEQPEMKFNDEM